MCASSRTSSNGRSCSPRARESTPISCPTTSGTAADSRCRSSWCPRGHFLPRRSEIAFQRGLIESALEQAGGVQKRAAELLQIKPTTLNEMIKRHDIRPRRKRVGQAGGRAGALVDTDDIDEEVASIDGD